ncbi:MAG: thiamine phosphate synthase [Acidobacteria bacterium]|nr:thiamine phosphate synthase [Acidobacteriota bacterium]
MNLPLHKPLLYLITNRQAFLRLTECDTDASRLQLEAIRQAAAAGCQLIQIREKDLPARALADFTRQAIAAARPYGAKVLVNDRLDVALATRADGVHLRVTSLPAHEVRRIVRQKGLQEFLIAVSTHSLAEAQTAAADGADFIVCGPVFDTPSKREFGAPLELERFAEICQSLSIPVLALGGINLANFREPLQRGASGIAAIGLFTRTETLDSTIQTLLAPFAP